MIKIIGIYLLSLCLSTALSASTQISQLQLQEKETTLILSKSLEAVSQTQGEREILNQPNSSSWKMGGFTTDIAMSADGTIGVLGGGGTAAVSILWGKKSETPFLQKLHTDFGRQWITAENASTVQFAAVSKKIKSPDQFKKNLQAVMRDFSNLTRDLDLAYERTQGEWKISTVKVNFGINAQGEIFLANPVHGELGFALQWRAGRKSDHSSMVSASQSSKKFHWSQEMVNIISSLQYHLENAVKEIESKKLMSSPFRASELGIGFGVTAQGEIGVARAGGSVMGILTFERSDEKAAKSPQLISLIQPQSIRLIDPVLLKEGLRKAVSIGDFFASCADRVSGPQWKPQALRASFEMGLNGNAGLVQIGEEISYQIHFTRLSP